MPDLNDVLGVGSNPESKSLVQRLTEDFRPGTPASKFMAEIKELSEEDRAWFVAQYNREGKPTVNKFV